MFFFYSIRIMSLCFFRVSLMFIHRRSCSHIQNEELRGCVIKIAQSTEPRRDNFFVSASAMFCLFKQRFSSSKLLIKPRLKSILIYVCLRLLFVFTIFSFFVSNYPCLILLMIEKQIPLIAFCSLIFLSVFYRE